MDIKILLERIKKLDVSFPEPHTNLEKDILGIHEAATKLWQVLKKNDKELMEKKCANLFIGAFILAKDLEINDLEEVFMKRLTELEKEFINP